MRADQRARRDAFLSRIGKHPVVMGILNVTPDSFSDGGLFHAYEAAIARAKAMIAQGCGIVDVGGESTRPGAHTISEDEELARVEPVLGGLAALDIPASIDTYKAGVARRAVELGAIVVNDVWGLQKDAAMAETVAAAEAAVIVMHNRDDKDESLDIIADIRSFFDRSLALGGKAGIPRDRIVLDPGFGFGKTSRQNAAALARLGDLLDYRLPIMVGVSRKAFLGSLTKDKAEATLPGTIAASLAAAAAGASLFRVHDVAAHVAALNVFHVIRNSASH